MSANKFTFIQYLGRRQPYRDGVCGSGLTFQKTGDVLPALDVFAQQMLKHPSVYKKVDAPAAGIKPVAVIESEPLPESVRAQIEAVNAQKKEHEKSSDIRLEIQMMDKPALEAFAQAHFNQKIDKRLSVDSLRQHVTGLYEQFGLNE